MSDLQGLELLAAESSAPAESLSPDPNLRFCIRCHYRWTIRPGRLSTADPKQCPCCHSMKWNQPRVYKRKRVRVPKKKKSSRKSTTPIDTGAIITTDTSAI